MGDLKSEREKLTSDDFTEKEEIDLIQIHFSFNTERIEKYKNGCNGLIDGRRRRRQYAK